jgi:hypothetical protein
MTQEDEKQVHDFFFEKSLYLRKEYAGDIKDIIEGNGYHFSSPIMGYCITCKGERPFSISTQNTDGMTNTRKLRATIDHQQDTILTVRKLQCAKCKNEYRYFVISEEIDEVFYLTKVGQMPSLADVSQNKNQDVLKLFRTYFSDLDRNEFNKALGLFAHGEGIAPLVFLRRIVERLVIKAFEDNKEEFSWSDEDFPNRMLEKIEFLKDVLPESLYEYRKIYGIMSKGIHELSEEECRRAFSDISAAIIFIVTDKARLEEMKKQRLELQKRIQSTAS